MIIYDIFFNIFNQHIQVSSESQTVQRKGIEMADVDELSDVELAQELKSLGANPGPITGNI